jgi:hypothetical protein
MTAKTTSLTVPPCAERICLISESRERAHSQRRCGPIGPLSDDALPGVATWRRFTSPFATLTISRATRLGARAIAFAARTASYGLIARSATE